MDTAREYLTREKKAQLEAELELLCGARRQEILNQLEYAKSLGDLSENAEYHEARELQGKNEDRIKKVEHVLKTCILIAEDSPRDVAVMGATVVVLRDNGEEKTLQIVGSEDADLAAGKISHLSPMGAALFGKRVGETATLETPRGTVAYTVTAIR